MEGWWLPWAFGTSPGDRGPGALEGVDPDQRREQ